MEKNNIKFKYLMGVWKTLPNYPTKEDIIYEISLYLLKDKRPNGEFSPQTFNSIFGSRWERDSHGQIIKKMIEDGDFIETKKSTASKIWYKINNNPYYKN
jgi:hypothetical protein